MLIHVLRFKKNKYFERFKQVLVSFTMDAKYITKPSLYIDGIERYD